MARLAFHRVRKSPRPHYPTRLDVQADPALLARHVPLTWLGRSELAGTVGLMLALQSAGCTSDVPETAKKPSRLSGAAVVAPIFEHGDGHGRQRGMFACIAVAAPVFLSEEEAIAVIREELGKAGLNACEANVVMPDLVIDGAVHERAQDWDSGKRQWRYRPVSEPLKADLRDPARQIAVEFVSESDFGPLGGNWEGKFDDDLKQAAGSLSEQVGRKGRDLRFAAFYDPMTYGAMRGWPTESDEDDTNRSWKSTPERAKAESARLLRMQVHDFVKWLQAQGAI